MKVLLALIVILALAGCKDGPTAASVKAGMTRDQVVAALGPGLVTGTKNDQIHNETWERISYRSGSEGLAVELVNGKVTTSYIVPNEVPQMEKKIRVGMTYSDVLAALGEPMGGRNSRDPNAMQSWVYGSPVAPVQTLNLEFKDGKVVKAGVFDNGVYGMQ